MPAMAKHHEMIFSLFPDQCPRICIAGGAAVSFTHAKDVDVFILTKDQAYVMNLVKQMPGFLSTSNKTLVNTTHDDYESHQHVFKVCGNVWLKDFNKIMQVIMSPLESIEDLLNKFDLDLCQRAIDMNGNWHSGDDYQNWTEVTSPTVIWSNTNDGSAERYLKYCKRFGLTAKQADLNKLINSYFPTE